VLDSQRLEQATILIADDQESNAVYLERVLQRAGYATLVRTTDARTILPLYLQHRPDLVLLDLMMPYLDGYAVLDQVRSVSAAGSTVPILVLTADSTPEAKQRALMLGATDFLTKPIDPIEVVLRIRNLLETRVLHLQLQQHNAILEEKVRARTRELEAAQIEILERLARAAEYRDDETGQHIVRVGRLAALLAGTLGLPAGQVELLHQTAPLHDVGKIGIADVILHKPGKLTAAEFAEMQQHTIIGARLLAGGSSTVLRTAQAIALTHHERWDGTGYPGGLTGTGIPLAGRIVAVVDVFDALTHVRPYKPAWSPTDALAEIRQQAGRQFDPAIVDALLQISRQPDFGTAPGETEQR
jgi:putative two-component system response regulator